MTTKTIALLGLLLTFLALVGGGVSWAVSAGRDLGRIEQSVTTTQRDVAEIKQTLRTIAPPTVKGVTIAKE